MSAPQNNNPRLDQAAVTDESLLAAHEQLLGKQKDDKAHYRLMPLNLLFLFSGLIFFGGTYLNSYSGLFDPRVFNENGHPPKPGGETAKVDPREYGKKLFNNAACNTCHQVNGMGTPGVFPPLVDSEWVLGSEERVIRIVTYGLQGPVTVKGVQFPGAAPMPAFGKVPGGGFNWSDDKIAAVLTYVRSEWGNNASAITAEQVTAIHAKEGDRKSYTADELLKLP
jgi:mono/diheme cytochrome c family protein